MVEIPALDFIATNTRPGEPAGADLRKKLARHVTVAAFFSPSLLTPPNRTVAVSSEHSPFVLAVFPPLFYYSCFSFAQLRSSSERALN